MGAIFLVLFGLTLFGLYIVIRRSWVDVLSAGGAAAILNFLWVVLYALINNDTSTGQAVFSGIVVGAGFSVVVVIIAAFFRTNQAASGVKLISQSDQEEHTSEREHDHD